MRIDVDTTTYESACSDFYDCNHGIIDAVSTLLSALGNGADMAGSDTGGEAWAAQYDQVAPKLVQAGCDLGQSMGQTANLLNASLKNHDGADYGARLDTPPQYQTAASDGDPDPNHWTETLSPGGVPSATGGIGGEPGWWHWIASHLEGLFWPDADTGKLRTIGQAWITAGTTIDAYTWTIDSAIWELKTQESPEIPDAVAACTELKQHTGDLADAYQQIGKACNDYAQHVDDHHQMIEDELASFVEWTVGIEAAGAIIGFFTLGAGEAAAQAAEAAEVANAASRVVRILRALVELAKTVAETIGSLLTKVTEILADLKKFLNVKAIAALEKIAPVLLRNKLLDELAAKGIKFTREDVVAIWKDAEGNIVFLEKGTDKAGLAHIVGEHGGEFAAKGIAEGDIPTFLQEALTNGTKVGYQGKGLGRPIYEVLWQGKMIKVAVTIGSNGYIVGANISG